MPAKPKSNYSAVVDELQQKGWALRNDGRFAEAETAFRKAFSEAQKQLALPGAAYTYATIYQDLADCVESQNRHQEAIVFCGCASSLLKNASTDSSRKLGCAVSLTNAQALVQLKQYDKAIPVLVDVTQKTYSDSGDHYKSLDLYSLSKSEKLLGDCYIAKGNLQAAEKYYRKAVELPEMVIPLNSRMRLPALQAYSNLLYKLEKKAESARVAARLADIEKNPVENRPCGTALRRQQEALNGPHKN